MESSEHDCEVYADKSKSNTTYASYNNSTSNKNSRTKIGKRNINILKNWLSKNEKFPYPMKDDLEQLIRKTKLTSKQIRVWFTNFRNRKFSPEHACISKIKYAITNKKFESKKDSDIRDQTINETSIHFMSRYYCKCDIKSDNNKNKEESINEKAFKFFKSANYCTCDLNFN